MDWERSLSLNKIAYLKVYKNYTFYFTTELNKHIFKSPSTQPHLSSSSAGAYWNIVLAYVF